MKIVGLRADLTGDFVYSETYNYDNNMYRRRRNYRDLRVFDEYYFDPEIKPRKTTTTVTTTTKTTTDNPITGRPGTEDPYYYNAGFTTDDSNDENPKLRRTTERPKYRNPLMYNSEIYPRAKNSFYYNPELELTTEDVYLRSKIPRQYIRFPGYFRPPAPFRYYGLESKVTTEKSYFDYQEVYDNRKDDPNDYYDYNNYNKDIDSYDNEELKKKFSKFIKRQVNRINYEVIYINKACRRV